MNSHISRIENGGRLPSVETLQRLADALEIPLYGLFYTNGVSFSAPDPALLAALQDIIAKSKHVKDEVFLRDLTKAVPNLNESARQLLLAAARKMANRN